MKLLTLEQQESLFQLDKELDFVWNLLLKDTFGKVLTTQEKSITDNKEKIKLINIHIKAFRK
jgi:hypothetical protein